MLDFVPDDPAHWLYLICVKLEQTEIKCGSVSSLHTDTQAFSPRQNLNGARLKVWLQLPIICHLCGSHNNLKQGCA